MPGEFENYFCYAAMWAFGGTLEEKHRKYFSNWWRKQWADFVSLPGDDQVTSLPFLNIYCFFLPDCVLEILDSKLYTIFIIILI